MNLRETRGRLLAQQLRRAKSVRTITILTWLVPSAKGVGGYVVKYDPFEPAWTCTCPDHRKLRINACKHIWAVSDLQDELPQAPAVAADLATLVHNVVAATDTSQPDGWAALHNVLDAVRDEQARREGVAP
jgi:hypothetical protein